MKTLNLTLQDDTDAGLLPVLAKVWKVNVTGLERTAALGILHDAMLDPSRAQAVWSALGDDQRGALQMLMGSGGKMPAAKFGRLFGEIRQMGMAQIEREKPMEKPASVAEALFYRGLVAQTFEMADSGPRVIVYVPEDLGRLLAGQKNSYSDLKELPDEPAATRTAVADDLPDEALVEPLTEVTHIKQADTSIVDDVATLLAYLQIYSPAMDGASINGEDAAALKQHFLKADDERVEFAFGLAISADLAEVQSAKAFPKRAEARRWLSATRAEQVQALAEGWKTSTFYRDLWHVPGLYPEPGGELDEYDAAVARNSALEIVNDLVPKQEWWSMEGLINAVKETEPDFQRPGGDYESWYIRGEGSDEYLTGFDNWEAIEGALLEFYITGPMHWLGLVDRADEAARLTAYGRAFFGQTPWPTPAEPEDKITVKDDGTLLISRKVSRVDRFQAARFASWVSAGDPYTYKVDGVGIQRAAEQGINTGHIASFISRSLGDAPVPANITRLLENWRGGASAAVSLEKLQVLRTTAPETLDRIADTPALRRYLGARLGPMAVIVRAGQLEGLRAALGEQGILSEVIDG
ncbi:MAG: hypothetical protein LCI00_08990 [Chloroflexi bacterium]|nr:hypothetical protein [Chloroflexota bacterium]MCC6893141.1 hypothetical protein [Anaerolineae bacterium]